jgi:hypothetical protein
MFSYRAAITQKSICVSSPIIDKCDLLSISPVAPPGSLIFDNDLATISDQAADRAGEGWSEWAAVGIAGLVSIKVPASRRLGICFEKAVSHMSYQRRYV